MLLAYTFAHIYDPFVFAIVVVGCIAAVAGILVGTVGSLFWLDSWRARQHASIAKEKNEDT